MSGFEAHVHLKVEEDGLIMPRSCLEQSQEAPGREPQPRMPRSLKALKDRKERCVLDIRPSAFRKEPPSKEGI
eukprot:scaffold300911_cov16-Tisochrysis_lutea.AAC.1